MLEFDIKPGLTLYVFLHSNLYVKLHSMTQQALLLHKANEVTNVGDINI